MAIRILIADDHRIMRAGLKSLMDADSGIEVVGEASDSDEAIALIQKLQPDIILMDVGMPGNENLQATGKIAALIPKIHVLILTMHEDNALLRECLRLGVSGYIIKRAAESELIDAIYAVQRGMIYVHPSMIQSLVASPQKSNIHHNEDEELTAREIEVLLLIVDGNTNRQISEKLHISVRTAETHRSNIMDKLNLHSRVDLVRYVNQHKFIRPN
jgi:two-component system response regulator NreC